MIEMTMRVRVEFLRTCGRIVAYVTGLFFTLMGLGYIYLGRGLENDWLICKNALGFAIASCIMWVSTYRKK